MKKYLNSFMLVCVVSIIAGTAAGQNNIYIGAKGGISIPNLTSGSGNQNPLSNGYSSRLGADFGVFAEFRVNKWLSIQPEIDYSAQGGKHNGLQAIPDPYSQTPPYLYADFKNQARLNYLLVPVMARFNFSLSETWGIYINAGAYAGFLLSAKTVSSGSSYVYGDPQGLQPISPGPESFDNKQDIKSSVHPFNTGVIGAIGISYKLGPGKIFIEGGGNYGFINIQKYAEDGKNYAGAATVHLGYEYALGRKK